jgi:hypothetical protein
MSNSTLIDELALSGTKNGKISIATISQPYGEKSESIVSVAISLDGNSDEPDWKVHIPKDNIDGIIEALKKAKELV